jgi:hypothetical protein
MQAQMGGVARGRRAADHRGEDMEVWKLTTRGCTEKAIAHELGSHVGPVDNESC